MIERPFDRFHVETEHFDLYGELEQDTNFPLNNHPQVFLLSACIGYQFCDPQPLIRPKQLTQSSSVFSLPGADTIYQAFKLIAMKRNVVEDGYLEVRKTIEEYAKAGFEKLFREILNTPAKKDVSLLNYMLLNLPLEDND